MAAARLIAEEGLDYSSAKRKAARQVVGQARVAGEWLPDNDEIEEEIREYQSLFQAESQPVVLRRLREIALDWMKRLAAFNPYLTGAVLNGTAGEHSDIYLQVFCDNPKEVAIHLLNANVQYEVSETRHFAGRGTVETLSFLARESRDDAPIGMHIALYDADDLRGAVRGRRPGPHSAGWHGGGRSAARRRLRRLRCAAHPQRLTDAHEQNETSCRRTHRCRSRRGRHRAYALAGEPRRSAGGSPVARGRA